MITFIKPYMTHVDPRGQITGLVQGYKWEEVNLIHSKKKTTRGQHYHKAMTECFIILSGKITIHLQSMIKTDLSATYTITAGDVFIIEPFVYHAFECITDARWINMLDKIVQGDFYTI